MVLGLATADFFTFFFEFAPLAPVFPAHTNQNVTLLTKLFIVHFPTLDLKIHRIIV